MLVLYVQLIQIFAHLRALIKILLVLCAGGMEYTHYLKLFVFEYRGGVCILNKCIVKENNMEKLLKVI